MIGKTLDLFKQQQLQELEQGIELELGLLSKSNRALRTIRNERLFPPAFVLFEEWCLDRFGIDRSELNERIPTEAVDEELGNSIPIPMNGTRAAELYYSHQKWTKRPNQWDE